MSYNFKKYIVEVENVDFEVCIDTDTGRVISVESDNKVFESNILSIENEKVYLTKTGEELNNIIVVDNGEKLDIINGYRNTTVVVKTERQILLDKYSSKMSDKNHDKFIKSPLPGLVTKILAKTGQELKKGDSIVVIEAMKMENEISAPIDCFLTSLNIIEGQTIDKGELIATLDGIK